MSTNTNVRFEDWKAEKLEDPGLRAAYERLEPAYQVIRLRTQRGLTQKELARLVGTRQPSIARLESGRSEPSLSFLRRVVEALGGRLEVRIEMAPAEESVTETRPALVFPAARPGAALETTGGESKDLEILPDDGACLVPSNVDSLASYTPKPIGAVA